MPPAMNGIPTSSIICSTVACIMVGVRYAGWMRKFKVVRTLLSMANTIAIVSPRKYRPRQITTIFADAPNTLTQETMKVDPKSSVSVLNICKCI